MVKDIFLSKEKLDDLKKELKELTSVKRPEIIAKIKEARALGDLSENAEYHSAREQQSFIEGKIEELEYVVRHAKIIDGNGGNSNGAVGIGSRVKCSLEADCDHKEFIILGSLKLSMV